jgi:VWFA-related protein
MTSRLLLLLTIGAAASWAAQAPEQPPMFFSEVRVNNITVDVKVTDAAGVPVEGLRREDFRIYENGIPQEVTNFFAVAGGAVRAAEDRALVGEPAPRRVLLFFDLYQMIEPDKNRVVDSMIEQVGVGLPPALEMAVVSFDGTLRVHTPATASAAKVVEALKAVRRLSATGLQRQITLSAFNVRDLRDRGGSPLDPRWRYSDVEYRRAQNAEYWNEMRRIIGRVENAFTAALQRFGGGKARKVALFISPGYPLSENLPVYQVYDLWTDAPSEYRTSGILARLAYQASELEYTLFALDPSGTRIDTVDASRAAPPALNDVASVSFWREADRKDNLIRAARLTGGEAVFSSDGAAMLADVERITSSYYSLAYQPDHAGDGRQYEIRVEVVGRDDVRLTHRTHYIDRPFDERDAERARGVLLAGEPANPLGVELVLDKPQKSFRMGAEKMRAYRVPVEVRIPYANLTMIPRGPLAWGQVQVVVLAVDPQGNQSDLSFRKVPIQLDLAKLEEARQRGYFTYTMTLELEGGARSLRVAVDDLLGRSTSAVVADLKL